VSPGPGPRSWTRGEGRQPRSPIRSRRRSASAEARRPARRARNGERDRGRQRGIRSAGRVSAEYVAIPGLQPLDLTLRAATGSPPPPGANDQTIRASSQARSGGFLRASSSRGIRELPNIFESTGSPHVASEIYPRRRDPCSAGIGGGSSGGRNPRYARCPITARAHGSSVAGPARRARRHARCRVGRGAHRPR
jgi:hypothetical protein